MHGVIVQQSMQMACAVPVALPLFPICTHTHKTKTANIDTLTGFIRSHSHKACIPYVADATVNSHIRMRNTKEEHTCTN